MKLPTSLAVVLGALYSAVLVVSTQLPLGKTLHVIIVGVGVFLAAIGIHPQAADHATSNATQAGPIAPPARADAPPPPPPPVAPPPAPAPAP